IFAFIFALQSLEVLAQIFVMVANSVAVIAIIFSIILAKMLRPETSENSPPQANVAPSFQKFLLGGWPFTIVALSVLVTQSGAFAIGGYVLDQESLGLLRGAERLAMIIGFSLTAINPFIAPRIAAAWAKSGAM